MWLAFADAAADVGYGEAFPVMLPNHRQGAGLGTELVRRLIEVARGEKLQRVIAHILSENQAMLKLATRFRFTVTRDEDRVSLIAILDLDGSVSAS
jgi:acetyltransferase